ncbi:DUF4097 family beta strand repeat-containing protein [Micromonospora sp. AMSO31t]|uniref:DUF4097 family beta strand repeat-containing protein n=1 Tax=Micromonospora sp. AMSO31t TaxID=2650566 RepID=UPI00124BBC4D|nr:DUF4097 family beta strand repeat-containing protein [Micromonospora sp. AMSO31t]KAB1910070.1 DUF4097 domain-containing protein [Micromonospora sp. AMSO31t]
MALHRTAVAAAAAASLIVLAGCDTLSFRRLDYDQTEQVKITKITVPAGGAGDVTIRATGPADQVRIKRIVRYQGGEPDSRYEIKGDELLLPSDCGSRCTVSWEVTAPEGVTVRGDANSGNVLLHRVGPVDFTLNSGDINVTEARGEVRATTTSGNIEVVDATGPVRLRASSGDISARRLAAGVDAEATSGNVSIELDKPAAARLHATSGDIDLTVPEGRYRVRADAKSGDTNLAVPNDAGASLLLDVSASSGNVTVNQR